PEGIRDTLNAQSPEVMVAAQPGTSSGGLSLSALEDVLERARSADAVLIGCGLGRDDETLEVVRRLVPMIEAPVVLDADGLTAFSPQFGGSPAAFADRRGPLALTPHLGEVRRLLESRQAGAANDVFDPEDRPRAAADLARRWGATVVLKGMPSVVGLEGGEAGAAHGRAIIGPPGEPALATAGSGDTLAGTIASLLAQGGTALEAAVCGLHLGSRAARIWADEHGGAGLIASDIVDLLPRAAHALRS
ncbi:NAD(P)H-hydrate dehydratase, partial [Rubrivirga sp.]|uniref:NAD(P)H-hydrate dehydratase n=1 Tax=Rubrivirga sp. TaxID=1885344 RepID=UPI003C70B5C7